MEGYRKKTQNHPRWSYERWCFPKPDSHKSYRRIFPYLPLIGSTVRTTERHVDVWKTKTSNEVTLLEKHYSNQKNGKEDKVLLVESNKKINELEDKLKKTKVNTKNLKCKYCHKYGHKEENCEYKKIMIVECFNVNIAHYLCTRQKSATRKRIQKVHSHN